MQDMLYNILYSFSKFWSILLIESDFKMVCPSKQIYIEKYILVSEVYPCEY